MIFHKGTKKGFVKFNSRVPVDNPQVNHVAKIEPLIGNESAPPRYLAETRAVDPATLPLAQASAHGDTTVAGTHRIDTAAIHNTEMGTGRLVPDGGVSIRATSNYDQQLVNNQVVNAPMEISRNRVVPQRWVGAYTRGMANRMARYGSPENAHRGGIIPGSPQDVVNQRFAANQQKKR